MKKMVEMLELAAMDADADPGRMQAVRDRMIEMSHRSILRRRRYRVGFIVGFDLCRIYRCGAGDNTDGVEFYYKFSYADS